MPKNTTKTPEKLTPKDLRNRVAWEGITIADIAEDLDVTTALIYRIFKGKYHTKGRAIICNLCELSEFEAFDYIDCVNSWMKVYELGWKQASKEYDFCSEIGKFPKVVGNPNKDVEAKNKFLKEQGFCDE